MSRRWGGVLVALPRWGGRRAVSGTIAFVGLIVPHLVRMVAGPGHRLLTPSSALGGPACSTA